MSPGVCFNIILIYDHLSNKPAKLFVDTLMGEGENPPLINTMIATHGVLIKFVQVLLTSTASLSLSFFPIFFLLFKLKHILHKKFKFYILKLNVIYQNIWT